MRIDEVILAEISDAAKAAQQQQRDLHNQKRRSGIGTDTKNYGRDTAQSQFHGVEVGDLTNVARKDQKDIDVSKDREGGTTQREPSRQTQPDGPSSADIRNQARADALRGRGRMAGFDDDDDDVKTGSDGRKLRHQRYYRSKKFDPDKEYDTILPRLLPKDALKKVKNTAASFIRNPSDTMANLRYKFKDLLQK